MKRKTEGSLRLATIALVALALLGVSSSARAQCNDPAARKVLALDAVDCPPGVGLAAGRAYTSDGRRYRAVHIAFTDPATNVTIYAQLVRGPRNTISSDPAARRYDIDVCIYGSRGVTDPLYKQVGGDSSVSACCDLDDINDPDDEEVCPEPPNFMLPMAAPPGQDEEIEELARDHLYALLTSGNYPWLRKWRPLYNDYVASELPSDPAALKASGLYQFFGAEAEARERAMDAPYGVVSFADGRSFPAMPYAESPSAIAYNATYETGDRARRELQINRSRIGEIGGWKHKVIVSGRELTYSDLGLLATACKKLGLHCEHSATFGVRALPWTWWQIAYVRCNHGGCPSFHINGQDYGDPTVLPMCSFSSSNNYDRAYHVHAVACHTIYDPILFGGHVCHDDSFLQYLAVRNDFHPYAWGYPCFDFINQWTHIPCW